MAWEFTNENGDCTIQQVFEGEGSTVLVVNQDQMSFDKADLIFIALKNENWSVARGDAVGLVKFETAEGWFEANALGDDRMIGFAIRFDKAEMAFDGTPGYLEVTKGGEPVDSLSLADFSPYWLQLKACRAEKQAVVREQQRQEALRRNIPRDPFG